MNYNWNIVSYVYSIEDTLPFVFWHRIPWSKRANRAYKREYGENSTKICLNFFLLKHFANHFFKKSTYLSNKIYYSLIILIRIRLWESRLIWRGVWEILKNSIFLKTAYCWNCWKRYFSRCQNVIQLKLINSRSRGIKFLTSCVFWHILRAYKA